MDPEDNDTAASRAYPPARIRTKCDLDERERIIEKTLQRLRETSRPLSPGERRRLIEEGRRLRERPSSNTPRVNPLRRQKRTSPKK